MVDRIDPLSSSMSGVCRTSNLLAQTLKRNSQQCFHGPVTKITGRIELSH